MQLRYNQKMDWEPKSHHITCQNLQICLVSGEVFDAVHSAFDWMPLGAVVAGKVLVLHGGLGDLTGMGRKRWTFTIIYPLKMGMFPSFVSFMSWSFMNNVITGKPEPHHHVGPIHDEIGDGFWMCFFRQQFIILHHVHGISWHFMAFHGMACFGWGKWLGWYGKMFCVILSTETAPTAATDPPFYFVVVDSTALRVPNWLVHDPQEAS